MKPDVVSFNTAALAKLKGFDGESTHYYIIGFKGIKPNLNVQKFSSYDGGANLLQSVTLGKGQPHLALAPATAELQKWLRDVHNIVVLVEHGRMEDESFGYFTRIYSNPPSGGQTKIFEYRSEYEKALDIGLEHALNMLP
jgi:hypothetical protein